MLVLISSRERRLTRSSTSSRSSLPAGLATRNLELAGKFRLNYSALTLATAELSFCPSVMLASLSRQTRYSRNWCCLRAYVLELYSSGVPFRFQRPPAM